MFPIWVIIAMLDFFWVKFSQIWPGTSPGAKVSSKNLKKFVEFVREPEWSNVPTLGDHRNAQLLLSQTLWNLPRRYPRSQGIIWELHPICGICERTRMEQCSQFGWSSQCSNSSGSNSLKFDQGLPQEPRYHLRTSKKLWNLSENQNGIMFPIWWSSQCSTSSGSNSLKFDQGLPQEPRYHLRTSKILWNLSKN
jgi:hypothetical protein